MIGLQEERHEAQVEAATTLGRVAARLQESPEDWIALAEGVRAATIADEMNVALEYSERAAKLTDNATVHSNYGTVLTHFARYEEAMVEFRKAFYEAPGDRWVCFAYAEALLRAGRWTDGWGLYERHRPSRLPIPTKQWMGQSLTGREVMVLPEGGLGDTLLMLRFAFGLNMKSSHAADWIVRDELKCLLDPHPWIRKVVGEGDSGIGMGGNYDYWVSELSLPAVFGVTPETMAWGGQYLVVPKGKRVKWSHLRFATRMKRNAVGFCWRAGEGKDAREYKSLSREQARQFIEEFDKVNWVNLQFGEKPVSEWMTCPNIEDLGDTAAIIEQLDLVVTVDTAVAHLAGVLQKPCWLMLPAHSYWVWGQEKENTVWYPTLKLFRSKEPGMAGAMNAVQEALRASF